METGFTPAAEAAAEQLASARMKGMSLTLDDIDTTEISEDVKARNEELLQTAALSWLIRILQQLPLRLNMTELRQRKRFLI